MAKKASSPVKKKMKFSVSKTIGNVSAELIMPAKSKALIALAHGAGAGMQHRFMAGLSVELAARGIGTFRFNFPFTENGKGRPDPPAVAQKTIEAALEKCFKLYPKIQIYAAGKSFGGRMSSHYLSTNFPEFVRGIVFYGFPLHAPGKASIDRADHLKTVKVPMLFLQGTRDALAKIDLIKKVASRLKAATLVTYEGGDHSFKSGKKEFITELAQDTLEWIEQQ